MRVEIVREADQVWGEAIADFAVDGNPGRKWVYNAPRGNPGRKWVYNAPAISPDGQAILYGAYNNLAEGEFFIMQSALPPTVPAGRTLVGRAYRITSMPGISLSTASLKVSYLNDDVASVGERAYACVDGTRIWGNGRRSARGVIRRETSCQPKFLALDST